MALRPRMARCPGTLYSCSVTKSVPISHAQQTEATYAVEVLGGDVALLDSLADLCLEVRMVAHLVVAVDGVKVVAPIGLGRRLGDLCQLLAL